MHTEQVQGGVVLLEAMGLGVVLLMNVDGLVLGLGLFWAEANRSDLYMRIQDREAIWHDVHYNSRTISCCEEWLWQGSLYHDAKGKGGMKSDSIGFDLRFTANFCSLDCPEIWWYNHDRSGRKLETR